MGVVGEGDSFLHPPVPGFCPAVHWPPNFLDLDTPTFHLPIAYMCGLNAEDQRTADQRRCPEWKNVPRPNLSTVAMVDFMHFSNLVESNL